MVLKKVKVALLASTVAIGVSATSVVAGGATNVNWAKVTHLTTSGPTSLADLVKAAKKEGKLNVVALPNNWANYGNILKGFSKKYGIKINSDEPRGFERRGDSGTQSDKGRASDPDVIDVGNSYAVTAQSEHLLAPYKVQTWSEIPYGAQETQGLLVR